MPVMHVPVRLRGVLADAVLADADALGGLR
jgi:hypothetical protein